MSMVIKKIFKSTCIFPIFFGPNILKFLISHRKISWFLEYIMKNYAIDRFFIGKLNYKNK